MSLRSSFKKPLCSLALLSTLGFAQDVTISNVNTLGAYFSYDRDTNRVSSNSYLTSGGMTGLANGDTLSIDIGNNFSTRLTQGKPFYFNTDIPNASSPQGSFSL